MIRIAVGLVVIAAGTGRAHADGSDYMAARHAWRTCFPANAPIEFPDDADITQTGTQFRIASSWGGSGSEAIYGGTTIELDAKSCAALWARNVTSDGEFAAHVRIGWAKRGRPNERELTALVAAPAHVDAPEYAMARAWLDHTCDGGPESSLEWAPGKQLAGPIARAQPWHGGPPARSSHSFWSTAQLHAIGGRATLDLDDDDEMLPRGTGPELTGVIVPALDAPTKTFDLGSIEVREVALPGRNDGRAIALYDRAAHRSRWVLLTRGCVQGSTVTWLGAIGTRIIGVTASRHGRYARGDAVVVIDTAAGTAWAVQLPDSVASGDVDRTHAALAGTTVTFGTGSATAMLDLATALAELH